MSATSQDKKVFSEMENAEKTMCPRRLPTVAPFFQYIFTFQEFFVERAFRIFDKDGSGTVSLAEFIETMHQFSGQGEDEKISFLFKVYDLNGRSGLGRHGTDNYII